MIIGIHQPELLPWYGYIHKLYNSDIFVILDDVQFKKNNFQNRNKVLTKNGEIWLSIPVDSKDRLDRTIRQTNIIWTKDWRKKFLSTVVQNYSKHEYYSELEDFISIFDKKYETIFDISFEILNYLLKLLKIDTKIILQSDIKPVGQKTELLLDICKKLNGDRYLMGKGGSDYFDYDLFKKNNIEVIHHDFVQPIYNQLNSPDEFIPYISFIDIIANIGKEQFKKNLQKAKFDV
ncbi:WbqC family protein [Aliarcobacter butzleri]|uniref:WbqC family protein n=1 Tax=Aliarcobacter butzleri TaxID=28197 RepID=UPI003B21B8A4